MKITNITGNPLADPTPWIGGAVISLVIMGLLGSVMIAVIYTANDKTRSRKSILVEALVSIFVSLALAAAMTPFFAWFLAGTELPMDIYEGKVTSVSEPTTHRDNPALLVTLEGLDEPMYLSYETGAEKAISDLEGTDAAFLCAHYHHSPKSSSTYLGCEALADKPGSEALEKLKAEGI